MKTARPGYNTESDLIPLCFIFFYLLQKLAMCKATADSLQSTKDYYFLWKCSKISLFQNPIL